MAYAVSKPSINSYQASNIVELLPHFKGKRRRGVVLTRQGWQKLDQAGVLCDKLGNRYTLEQLSERALLDSQPSTHLRMYM